MNYQKFQEYQTRAYSTVYSENEGGFHDDVIRQLSQQFLPLLTTSPSDLIVDIGCGPGVFMERARDLGYTNLMGVTLSRTDQAVCESKGFVTKRCSMSDLDLADATVDLVWCRHALEHSPYPLFTLYEFDRVLKPQGRLYVEVPAPDNERAFIHEYNPNHYSIMGERMWDGLFEKAGFEILQYHYSHIDVLHEDRTVKEKSYLFLLHKSAEDLEAKFLRKYGLHLVTD